MQLHFGKNSVNCTFELSVVLNSPVTVGVPAATGGGVPAAAGGGVGGEEAAKMHGMALLDTQLYNWYYEIYHKATGEIGGLLWKDDPHFCSSSCECPSKSPFAL